MRENTRQVMTVVAGILLIVVYSVVMMATEGSSGWAWILLIVGIGLLISGGLMLRGSASSGDDGSA